MRFKIQKQLESQGYAIIDDFLTPFECDELKEAALGLATSMPENEHKAVFSTDESSKQQLIDQYFLESNDKIRFFFEKDAIAPDGNLLVGKAMSLNKIGHALHLLHPIFRCYTFCQRVKEVCYQLGFQVPSVVQSMYIFKNPGIGGGVSAHQDATYLHTEPTPPVGFWIAVDNATVENGCLYIARGSHKSGVHRRLKRVNNPDGTSQLVYDGAPTIYPESSFTAIPVTKGTCILIHGHVVHKSAPNRSTKSRHAYTFHVIEKQNNEYSPDNWLQEGPNAPFTDMFSTQQMIQSGNCNPSQPIVETENNLE